MKTTIGLVCLSAALVISGCESLPDSSWFNLDADQDEMVNQPEKPQPIQPEVINVMAYQQQRDPEVNLDDFGNPAATGTEAQRGGQRGGYLSHYKGRHVGDYVQSLTQELVNNMEYVSQHTPVGVTHFAMLDSDLQQTNLLGLQLAESFMHELHKFRIPVVDYKSTDFIRVTEQGDFFLSRDFLELKEHVSMQYVLTGTLTRHSGGYLVNARMLGMKSKAVVASAQMLIPFHVVDALLGETTQQTKMTTLRKG